MAEFTPGPWMLSDRGITIMARDTEIALMNMRHDEWVANARLIAAAPDLLGELQEIIDGWTTIERNQVRGRKLTAWETERLTAARGLVAKIQS